MNEREALLKGSCITGLKLPRMVYVKTLADMLGASRQQADALAKQYKKDVFDPRVNFLKDFDLDISELRMGMFNGVIDTGDMVNIVDILKNVLQKGLVSEDNIKVIKVSTVYGKFKKAFEVTQEYGEKVYAKIPPSKISSIEFILSNRANRTQGASFTVFKTGRVRFSGGYTTGTQRDATQIINFMKKHYFDASGGELTINNNTTQFKIGLGVKVVDVFTILDKALTKNLASFGDYEITAEYEPERSNKNKKKSPFLYIKFKGPQNFSFLCAPGGVIQIQGTLNVRDSYGVAKRFFKVLKDSDLLRVPSYNRRPQQNSVNKGPTNRPARLNMMPAPDITRRGTTCPKASRPVPYSFQGKCPQGAGYYVRPNPQGQPCCYKIPKRIDYIRAKVAKRYQMAGVKVPENVQKLFGIPAGQNKPTNVSKVDPEFVTYINKKRGIKIGTRQCTRFTKVGLIDLAMRMNIGPLPKFISKPKLCELIHKRSRELGRNITNTRNVHTVNGRLKFGNRFCDSYKKSTLTKYARELGIMVNKEMTKEQICKLIKRKRENKFINNMLNKAVL